MNRVWTGACFVLGLALTASVVWTSEGFEASPSMDTAVSARDQIEAPLLLKPFLHVHRAATNYSRHQLVKLLPSKKHLPPHLAHREHWDYPGPLQWVPRGWTTYGWGRPSMVLGNQEHALDGAPKPIGERGSFQISVYPDLPVPFCWVPIYFAFTLPNGVHFRLGARWDDIDSYVNLPSIAIKKRVE